MKALLSSLGAVCPRCDTYNSAGALQCTACATALGVLADGATSSAAAAPAVPPPPAAPVSAAAAKTGANAPVAPRTAGSPQASSGQSGALGAVVPKLKLVVVRGQVGAGSSFKLGANACTAGRSKGLLLFPNDNFVAPLHATFFFREGKLFVRDENTPSGTFVTVSKELIPAGTFFAVGDTLLRYLGPLPAAASSQVAHYGAPLPPGPMYLVEEVLEGLRPGRCMARPGPTVAVGQAGCEFLVADAMVSPRHCELTFNPQGATLRDLGSQTGTFVRIAPGAERALAPGDQVRLGNEILRVEAV